MCLFIHIDCKSKRHFSQDFYAHIKNLLQQIVVLLLSNIYRYPLIQFVLSHIFECDFCCLNYSLSIRMLLFLYHYSESSTNQSSYYRLSDFVQVNWSLLMIFIAGSAYISNTNSTPWYNTDMLWIFFSGLHHDLLILTEFPWTVL